MPSQPLPLTTAAWIFFCSSILACLSASDELQSVERVLLLREDQIGAGRARRRHRDDAVDLLLACRRDQRHRAAFAVARRRRSCRSSTSLRFESHFTAAHHIVGVVGERRGLGASAALADAALVVAQDDERRCRRAPSRAARRSECRRPFRRGRSGPSRRQHDRGRAEPVGDRRAASSACRRG